MKSLKCDVDEKVVEILKEIIKLSFLSWKELPEPDPEETIYTEEYFLNMKTVPKKEIYGGIIFPMQRAIHLPIKNPELAIHIKHVRYILDAKECTNAVLYPPNSIMDWHTNRDSIGERIYYVYNLKRGVFKYVDPDTKEIVVDYDNPGWTCRRFKIEYDRPLWHSVWSEGKRFAFGFNTHM